MPENIYLVLAMVVLLPIVPAYLLFKLLPKTDGWVGGMFQGLEFKFSGAFAGYLMVLWVVHGYLPPNDFEIWTVEGKVALDGDPRDYDDVRIFLSPNDREAANGSGRLHFGFIRTRNGAASNPLPTILVEAEGYELTPVDLEEKPRDARARKIEAGTIPLTRLPDLPAYAPGSGSAQIPQLEGETK